MPRPRPTPDILGTSEAAALVQVSAATLKRWARAGFVPSERTKGGHRRFRRQDLETFTGTARGQDGVSRRVDLLLEARSPLQIQAELHRERERHASWWEACATLREPALELHRRLERGVIGRAQWEAAFAVLRDALARFRDGLTPPPGAPALLVASVPGDVLLLQPTAVELGALEAGWAPRWAGHLAARELAAELRRSPAAAVLLCASFGTAPAVIALEAPGLAAACQAAQAPLGLVGLGWTAAVPGTRHLGGLVEVRDWLAGLPAAPPPPARHAGADGVMPAWTPALALGVPAIDLQHQRLFAMAGRLAQAAREAAEPRVLRQLLAFLGEYAEGHFRSEENLMRQARYPEAEVHRAEHEKFRRFVSGLTAELADGGATAEAYARAAAFVRAWLVDHVGGADQRIASHILSRRR